ncbi:MAG: histidine--tRNA ligase [Proteobacteria bacterium]|nr:histidine--tRNA ligase [Pseudomonadota bacterium]
MAITASRGSVDILPVETPRWRKIEEAAHRLALLFGYSELRTPAFEATELYSAFGDDSDIVDKELYTFRDRSGRSLTLRPEFTVATVRAALEHSLLGQTQLKSYYLGEVWRYDRPQSGRLREGHQFGAEVLGSASPAVEAELIDLALTFLQECGLREVRLEVNSVGCKKCRPAYMQVLRDFLQGKDDVLCSDCERRRERNPLRVLDCRKDSCLTITNTAPTVFQSLCTDCRGHFFTLKEHLGQMGHAVHGSLRVVNALGIYNRNVWQIVSPQLGSANPLCGGGRFDELVAQMGGSATPAAGLSIGLERVLAALDKEGNGTAEEVRPDVFLIGVGEEAERVMTRVSHQLRKRGHRVERDYSGRGIKNQTKAAEKSGAPFTVLLGEEETRVSQVVIGDVARGTQETLSVARLIEHLDFKLRRDARDRGRDRGREERARRGERADTRSRVREESVERETRGRDAEGEREPRVRARDENGRSRGRGRRYERPEDEGGARFDEWASTYSEAARNAPERPPRASRLAETALTETGGDDLGRQAWSEAQGGLLQPQSDDPLHWPVAPVGLAAPIPVSIPERVDEAPVHGVSWLLEPGEEGACAVVTYETVVEEFVGVVDIDDDDSDEGDDGEDGLAGVGAGDGGEGADGARRRRGGRRGGRRHGRRRSRKS